MGPDETSRRNFCASGERIATYLLLVLVGLLAARAVSGFEPPLDATVLAVVIAALLLAAQLVRPGTGRWAAEVRTGVSARQAAAAVAGLAVAGAALRLYALGAPSFWFDEAITTNAAIGLLERGRPGFPSGAVYWRGFPHTLLVAGSLAGFGVSEWAARLPSVLAGVASIPVTYWLGRELGNRRVGLLAAVLVTFLTWEIAWSRQARMYQLLQLAYAIALLGLARVDRTGIRDPVTLALVGAGTLVGAMTHRIGLILFPVSVGYLLVNQVTERDRFDRRDWVIVAGVLVLAGALELLGTGPLAATRTVLGVQIDHLDRYRRVGRSTLGPVAVLALAGLGLGYRHRTHGLLLTLALVPPAWILAFHTRLFAMRYFYFAVPVLAVAIGFLLELGVEQSGALLRWAGTASPAVDRRLRAVRARLPTAVPATVLPVLVVLLVVAPSLTVVPQPGYRLGPNAPQPDFASAYDYVDANARSDAVLVAGWTAPAQYYHGSVDYWLEHALTSADRTWTTDAGVEIYSGATPVRNAAQLRAVIDCNPRGWVVIDEIVHRKLDADSLAVLENLTVHDTGAAGMHVYSWSGSGDCSTHGDDLPSHGDDLPGPTLEGPSDGLSRLAGGRSPP